MFDEFHRRGAGPNGHLSAWLASLGHGMPSLRRKFTTASQMDDGQGSLACSVNSPVFPFPFENPIGARAQRLSQGLETPTNG